MYREYQQRFGSWNNAIKLAGYEANPVIFSKKFLAKDCHVCDSFAEKIIDDWFYIHKIPHERNFPYKGTKMKADFKVKGVFIEYLGLAGEISSYDRAIRAKRTFAGKKGIKLIEIYPNDLFVEDSRIFLRKIAKNIS